MWPFKKKEEVYTIGVPCKVRTPQFKNGKIDYWHTQEGFLNPDTFVFTPKNYPKHAKGDHKIDFHNMEGFKKFQVK